MFTKCSAVEPVSEGNAPLGWWRSSDGCCNPHLPNPPSCQWCHPIFYPLNINFPNSQLLMDHPGNLIHRAALSVCLLVFHQNTAKQKVSVQQCCGSGSGSIWIRTLFRTCLSGFRIFLGLSRNQNFDPESGPERNSQFFSGIRNSGRISGRPGIRNGIRNLAGNLKNKFIFNKRFEHMIIL